MKNKIEETNQYFILHKPKFSNLIDVAALDKSNGKFIDNLENDVDKIKEIPAKTGLFIFYNADKEMMYVGKARDLKARFIAFSKDSSSTIAIAKEIDSNNIKYFSYAVDEDFAYVDVLLNFLNYIYEPKLAGLTPSETKEYLKNL